MFSDLFRTKLKFGRGNRIMFGPGIFTTLGRKWFKYRCRFHWIWCLGDDHRKQRKMLNPVFSISHMREMGTNFVCFHHDCANIDTKSVPIFYAVAHKVIPFRCNDHLDFKWFYKSIIQLQNTFQKKLQNGPEEVWYHVWTLKFKLHNLLRI